MREKLVSCLGLSHRTAPLGFREKFRCSPAAQLQVSKTPVEADSSLAGQGPQELVWLATCNRIELYAAFDSRYDHAATDLKALLCQAGGISCSELDERVFYLDGWEAVEHLCRVAAGLDSIFLGETQILGQVKAAAREASRKGILGEALGPVFSTSIRAGQRARAETGIGRDALSPASAAISWSERHLGPLDRKKVIVVGLGEMGRLVLKVLRNRGIQNVSLVNRTLARAQRVAGEYGYHVLEMSDPAESLMGADVVFLATSATSPIIDKEIAERLVVRRGGAPLAIVDLGVPRNAEPRIGELKGLRLCQAHDLERTMASGLRRREAHIPAVERIIREELAALGRKFADRGARPVVVDLRRAAESIRQRELKRALRRLPHADPVTVTQFKRFSHTLVNQLLHEPTLRLRKRADPGGWEDYEVAVRELFGLQNPAILPEL